MIASLGFSEFDDSGAGFDSNHLALSEVGRESDRRASKSDVGLNSAQSQKPKDMQQEESFAPVVNVIGDGDAGAVVVQKLIINVCGGDGLSSFERLH